MISDRKWKSLYKALHNIVRDKQHIKNDYRLKCVLYMNGAIYATDSYVAVKIEFNEALPLEFEHEDEPIEDVAYEIFPNFRTRECLSSKPNIIDQVFIEEGDTQIKCFNPRLMIEVCDVFKVFDLNPLCLSNGKLLYMKAQNGDISIQACLMGCRV